MSSEELFPQPKAADTPLRDLVELTPPRQVALGALGRAKAAAAQRGYRPGDPARRRPLVPVAVGTAGPGARDPQLIGSTVSGLLDQLGGPSDQVAGVLKHRWSELVGPQVAEHCEYVSFEGGALTLRAHSTSWATQLRFLAPAMLGPVRGGPRRRDRPGDHGAEPGRTSVQDGSEEGRRARRARHVPLTEECLGRRLWEKRVQARPPGRL